MDAFFQTGQEILDFIFFIMWKELQENMQE